MPGEFPALILEAMREWFGSRTDQFKKNLDEVGAAIESQNPDRMLEHFGPGAMAHGVGAIKTFQGSPWKFRNVDDRAIGSGEGTQFEGWGHYTSDQERVGRGYADMFGRGSVIDRRGRPLSPGSDPDPTTTLARKALHDVTYDYKPASGPAVRPEELYDAARDRATRYAEGSGMSGLLDEIMQHLRDWQEQGGRVGHSGRVYDVQLKWPSRVQEKTDPLRPDHYMNREQSIGDQPQVYSRLQQMELPFALHPKEGGRSFYQNLSEELGSPKAASKKLFEGGIPGIRYPDPDFGFDKSGNRATNYVTFSDMLMNIMRRRLLP